MTDEPPDEGGPLPPLIDDQHGRPLLRRSIRNAEDDGDRYTWLRFQSPVLGPKAIRLQISDVRWLNGHRAGEAAEDLRFESRQQPLSAPVPLGQIARHRDRCGQFLGLTERE